jgi:PAS domain S-box-containing protein
MEEHPGDAALVAEAFEADGFGHAITAIRTPAELDDALSSAVFDVFVTAAGGGGRDPFEILRTAQKRQPGLPVVFFSDSSSQELAVLFLKAGASDFVSKKRALELVPAVDRALWEAAGVREKAATQAALVESEKHYRAIVEDSTEWIWEMDPQFRHAFNNRAVERVLGYTPEELLGRGCFDLMHEEDASIARSFIDEAIAKKTGWTDAIIRWRHKDGTYRYFESNSVALLGPDGELLGFRGSDRDASARLRLEEELRNTQKMEAVGRLAAGVAHDFNNLLTSITGYGYLLKESLPPGDERLEFVEEIGKASERAATLTHQLLAFSQQQITRRVPLDVCSAVRELERLLRNLILGGRVELVLQLPASLQAVHIDARQLEQILIELVMNARDAMPRGGRIFIEVSAGDPAAGKSWICLSVRDTGSGMDPATLAHVFEPFYTTRGRASGRGLGLSTVYGIVKHAGGHIAAFSTPGEGSRFDVFLPALSEVPTHAVEESVSAARPSSTGRTVLLVEDEAPVRMLVRKSLQKGGYEVLEAGTAEEARALSDARGGPIDLLVADSVLPGLSGPALARELAVSRPEMRVLFVSGYTDDEALRGGQLRAGQAFLQKPFSLDALSTTVRDLLEVETPAA